MMMVGEPLGELVAGVVVPRDDPDDRADLFEDDEVAVDARLRESVVVSQDLGDRHRAGTVEQRGDESPPAPRVALVGTAEQVGDLVVDR